jgi:hypothetical protein
MFAFGVEMKSNQIFPASAILKVLGPVLILSACNASEAPKNVKSNPPATKSANDPVISEPKSDLDASFRNKCEEIYEAIDADDSAAVQNLADRCDYFPKTEVKFRVAKALTKFILLDTLSLKATPDS